jgi:hypothetical protein
LVYEESVYLFFHSFYKNLFLYKFHIYFQLGSLLNIFILMRAVKRIIPYGDLEMNYHFCSYHNYETFFLRVGYVLLSDEKPLETIVYVLGRENSQISMHSVCHSSLFI